MKALITGHSHSFIVILTPESDEDKKTLEEFGKTTSRAHMINCRGFEYLSAEVEFLVQPMPSSD